MRPEVHAIKDSLKAYTGQVWSYEDAHFVSAPLPPTMIERMLERDNIPASVIPSTQPGEIRQRLSMTFENAEQFVETMQNERGTARSK